MMGANDRVNVLLDPHARSRMRLLFALARTQSRKRRARTTQLSHVCELTSRRFIRKKSALMILYSFVVIPPFHCESFFFRYRFADERSQSVSEEKVELTLAIVYH